MSLLVKAAKRHGTEKKSFKFELKIHKVALFQPNRKLFLRVVWTRGKRLVATKWCEGFNEFEMEENLFHIATMYIQRDSINNNNNNNHESSTLLNNNGIQPKDSELILEIRDKIDGKNVKFAKMELNLATFIDLSFPSKLISQKLFFQKSKTHKQASISISMKATESKEIINDHNGNGDESLSPVNRHHNRHSASDDTFRSKPNKIAQRVTHNENNDNNSDNRTYNDNANIISQSYQASSSFIPTGDPGTTTHRANNNKKHGSRVVQSYTLNSAKSSSILLGDNNDSLNNNEDFDSIYSDLKLLSPSQKKASKKTNDTNKAEGDSNNSAIKASKSVNDVMSRNVGNDEGGHKTKISNNEERNQSKNRQHKMKKRLRSYSTSIPEKSKNYKMHINHYKLENNIIEQENENSDCDQFENIDENEKKTIQSNNQNTPMDENEDSKENENDNNNNRNTNYNDENKNEMKSRNVGTAAIDDDDDDDGGKKKKNEIESKNNEEAKMMLEKESIGQEKKNNHMNKQMTQSTADINISDHNEGAIFEDIYDITQLVNLDVHTKHAIDEKNKQICSLEEEIKKLQKNIDNSNKTSQTKENEYKIQIESLQAERQIYEMKAQESKENVRRIELQMKSIMDERNHKINSLENEIQESNKKYEKLSNEMKDFKTQYESLEKQIEDKNNTIRSLFQSNDSNETLIKTLNEEIEKYKKKIDFILKENQNLKLAQSNNLDHHQYNISLSSQYTINDENYNDNKKKKNYNSSSFLNISSSDLSSENRYSSNDEVPQEEKIIENGNEKEISTSSAGKSQINQNVINDGDEIKENGKKNNANSKNNAQLTTTQIREFLKQAQQKKSIQSQQSGFSNEISKLLSETQNKRIGDNDSSTQKMQTEWIKAETDKMKLQQALQVEKTQNLVKQMEYEKLLAKCNRMENESNKMKQEHNETKMKFEKLENVHIKLKFDFTNMIDRINTLEFENKKFKNVNEPNIHNSNANNNN